MTERGRTLDGLAMAYGTLAVAVPTAGQALVLLEPKQRNSLI
jgi:hypothetical protein